MRICKAEPLRYRHLRDEQPAWIDNFFLNCERENQYYNRRMFEDDFALLFSSLQKGTGNLFDVASNDDELTEKLLANVKVRHGPHRVDETVRLWVEEIAQELIGSGVAYYYLYGDLERGDIHISWFSSNGVIRIFGTDIQWVPKRVKIHTDRDDEESSREVRILDSDNVMRFVLPKAIKRMLTAQNKTLAVLDKHQNEVTNFLPRVTHEDPNPTNHFEFSVWRDMQDRALYRSARATGWNGRKHDASKRSDFFDCQRLIRFQRNQLLLRDDILRQLSAELSRIGKGYEVGYGVEISGTGALPSVAQLNELEVKLMKEVVGFTEVIDHCYSR